jgi:alkylation response protein AidB-like acyl-CoA dehydrogenase
VIETLSAAESAEIVRTAQRFVDAEAVRFRHTHGSAGRDERRAIWVAAARLGWASLLTTDDGSLAFGNAPVASEIFKLIGARLLPDLLVDALVMTPTLVAACGERATGAVGALSDGSRYVATAFGADDENETVATDPFRGATLTGDRMTGVKTLVRDGAWADGYLVGCRRETRERVVVFAPSDAQGVSAQPQTSIDGMAAPARVRFAATPVVVLAEGETAEAAARIAAAAGRLAIVSEIAGLAEVVTDMSVQHARSRVQFGRPIGSFQAVKHLLAEMWRETYQADCVREETALRFAGLSDSVELEMLTARATAWAAPFVVRCVEVALQVHGGIGFTAEGSLSPYYLHALTLLNAAGNPRDLARLVGTAMTKPSRG